MGRLMSSDSMMIGGLGAAGVLVMGLVGLVFRRRKEEWAGDGEESVEEAAVLARVGRPTPAPHERERVASTPGPTVESPFGAAASAGGGMQDAEGQLDALSEVDVYVAYGRYEQAAELLQGEIERQPGRLDLKHRLLDVYSTMDDRTAFVSLAEEMRRAGAAQEDPESWRMVVARGRELAPGNPLFAASAAVAASIAAAQPTPREEPQAASSGLDFDLDLEALEAGEAGDEEDIRAQSAPEADPGVGLDQERKAEADDGFDFDLDLEALSGAEASATQPTEPDERSDADLDLDKLFSFGGAEPGAADAAEQPPLAWDFKAEEQEPTASLAETEDLDQALAELEFEAKGEEETLSLDEVAGSFMPEPELTARHIPEEGPEELSLEGLDLSEGEEDGVETMLDLAQIYVDMGHQDDARDILEEALKDGDEGQQQRAREILQSLS